MRMGGRERLFETKKIESGFLLWEKANFETSPFDQKKLILNRLNAVCLFNELRNRKKMFLFHNYFDLTN